MPEPVSWVALRALVEAQTPGAGGVATWAAILQRWEASGVLYSRARQEAGYRIDAMGVLPALLVLPRAWRPLLPPVPEAWLVPSLEGEP